MKHYYAITTLAGMGNIVFVFASISERKQWIRKRPSTRKALYARDSRIPKAKHRLKIGGSYDYY